MTAVYDSRTDRGIADLKAALAQAGLLWMLALRDIRARYRRSTLGPFWITASMTATVFGMSFVFAALMNRDYQDYVPYLAVGMAVWSLLTGMIGEGSTALINAAHVVKNTTGPLSAHVFRQQFQHLIFYAHNILPGFALILLVGHASLAGTLLSICGLALTFFAASWMGLLVAVISARFRDVPQIVVNVVQVLFFLTPIIWNPADLGRNRFVLDLNPFYYLVTIVRDPLRGVLPPGHAWLVVAAIGIIGWIVTALVYERVHDRLTKWL